MNANEHNRNELIPRLIANAQAFGADVAGVAGVADLKRSPSHRISEKMPEYSGVGTKEAETGRRGIVQWPEGAGSAVVIGLAHPLDQPELDWWETGESVGNTAGNRLLMRTVSRLAAWLETECGIRCLKIPYHIEHGGVYMKDAAVLAGLGCIGKNNLLVTPRYGPRIRLRVMLTDAALPSMGPIDFDPCADCPMPCRAACPQHAFAERVYSQTAHGQEELPGRSGVYDRLRCNREMTINNANFEEVGLGGGVRPGRRVRYCRECERVCPAGAT